MKFKLISTLFACIFSVTSTVLAESENSTMEFSNLLGKSLKDDAVMEILEVNDIDVIYDFDRTHENMDDIYWAGAKNKGFLFRFNKHQKLDTIFLYMVEREGYTPIDRQQIDVPIYETFDHAEKELESKNISYAKSPGEPGSRTYKWWIKPNFSNYTVHYQFKNGAIRMITLGIIK